MLVIITFTRHFSRFTYMFFFFFLYRIKQVRRNVNLNPFLDSLDVCKTSSGFVFSFLAFSDEFHRHGSKSACYLGEWRTSIRVYVPALFHQLFPFRSTCFRYWWSKRVLHNPTFQRGKQISKEETSGKWRKKKLCNLPMIAPQCISA